MSNSKKLFYALIIITIVYVFIVGAFWTAPNLILSEKLFWTGIFTFIAYGIPVGVYLSINE